MANRIKTREKRQGVLFRLAQSELAQTKVKLDTSEREVAALKEALADKQNVLEAADREVERLQALVHAPMDSPV